ncbi:MULTISPECIES: C13 family peptidase [unclassified Sphingomonas]|uniref:C13 family peptidase n=1 Tax=unclassified Sphingomonas TaxID=196159 RepID=UPI002151CEF4|nr:MULTISPECIES: C13 family peptidase [unclassified Sphingomonas]MCR5871419.1 C13 family peptidase [Sphingomonas sp. J344]UUY00281.1 C13 family peptidase [Sphingomonas sp. J315]
MQQADGGLQIERDRTATHALAEHRRLTRALATLLPHRKGVVDAYVLSVGLDSDPVFGREAREAGKVLSRRYDALGRTIILGGSDGKAPSPLPMGSPANIEAALARIAELMDEKEDVLVLYTTSHGAPFGVVYNDGNEGFGAISPRRLAALLRAHGIERRLLIVSACYSGVFVPVLSGPQSAVVSAAASDRSSFGCAAENDWTFFGDALVNRALRKPQPLGSAVTEAFAQIAGWETRGRLKPSLPQQSFGVEVQKWLAPLEARMPKVATAPVGKPSVDSLGAP